MLSKPFESIHEIKGVTGVVYESPYLWVIIDKYDERSRVFTAVTKIIDSTSDPDLQKIEDPINLRVCDATTFRSAINDLRHYNSLKTIRDLETFCKQAYFTTLYTLNWESNPVSVERFIRKRHSARLIPDLIERERLQLDQLISKLQNDDSRPEKLLLVVNPSIGIATYPVYKGMIKIDGKEFSFSKFRLKFEKTN